MADRDELLARDAQIGEELARLLAEREQIHADLDALNRQANEEERLNPPPPEAVHAEVTPDGVNVGAQAEGPA